MSSEQFKTDLKRGSEGQNYVRDLIRSWGQTVTEAPNRYWPDWDLKVNDCTVEVKHDILACKTGRICLELEALDHSKADLLAIVTENPRTVYFTPLSVVRDFAHQWYKTVKGGEFNQPMALVPRSIFINRLKPQILTVQSI